MADTSNVGADFVGIFKSLHARIFRFRGEDDRGENVKIAHRIILSELFFMLAGFKVTRVCTLVVLSGF